MSIQSVVGVIISSCMAGIVFAKLARPKNRSHTVMFSKNAVVTQARSSFLPLNSLLFVHISLLNSSGFLYQPRSGRV